MVADVPLGCTVTLLNHRWMVFPLPAGEGKGEGLLVP